MEPVSQEELISLYFDGVATAEEQQEAVRLLEQNSAARAWLAQLEQMRSSLASLPRHNMPVDCTSHVLQRAGQEMLSDRSLTHRVERPDSESQATVSRRQMWVAFAVAAVALIVVVLPNVLARLNPLGVALRDAKQGTEEPVAEAQPSESKESIVAGGSELDKLSGIQPMAEATQPTHTATRLAAPGRAEGDASESEKLDASRLIRKAAPQGKAGAADFGDEVAKDRRGLGNAPPANSAAAPAESFSYVYNVSTPEAQKAVLETFEKTLREQQIVLESIAPENAEQAAPLQSLATRSLGGGGIGGFGSGPGLPTLQSNQQSEKSLDCVYVLEATQLQLSNTIHTLDNLASPAALADRARRLTRADDEPRQRQQNLAPDQDSPQRAKAPAGQPQPTSESNIAGGYANRYQLNRSQAVRFSTEFADPPMYEAGRGVVQQSATPVSPPAQQAASAPAPMPAERPNAKTGPAPAPVTATPPAEPSAARPAATGTAVRDRSGVMQRRGNTEQEQREPLQRAVIIFRVVPADAKIE